MGKINRFVSFLENDNTEELPNGAVLHNIWIGSTGYLYSADYKLPDNQVVSLAFVEKNRKWRCVGRCRYRATH